MNELINVDATNAVAEFEAGARQMRRLIESMYGPPVPIPAQQVAIPRKEVIARRAKRKAQRNAKKITRRHRHA